MIDHAVNALLDVKVQAIYVVGTYEPRYFGDYCNKKTMEVGRPVKYLTSQSLLPENILVKYKQELFGSETQHIIVMSANSCFDYSLKPLLAAATRTKKSLVLLCKHIDQYDKQEGRLHLKIDPQTGDLMHAIRQPTYHVSDIISCGVYCLRRDSEKFIDIPSVSFDGFGLEGYPPGVSKDKRGVVEFPINLEPQTISKFISGEEAIGVQIRKEGDFHFALNSASDLVKANQLFLKSYRNERHWRILDYLEFDKTCYSAPENGVYIHSTAKVAEDADLGPNCYIGRSVVVGKGARISNAIILGGSEVGDFSVIFHALIGFNSSIGNWSRVEGIPEKWKVTVVGVGVTIAPEVHIFDCLLLPNKQAVISYYSQTVL